ncbi:hypothetical protein Fmac_011905 [Flemingia macrophylla]|uniref:Leucine-rich repeat-containing N-terminal plant-type domain-containing protein n=1 Tax=Flemingia macrophylla TaxID=520843 RepID=A0ABD1MNU2_9FABA
MVVAAAASDNYQEERQALLQSGWWNDFRNISDYCEWDGIACNGDASVIEIWGWDLTIPPSKELRRIQKLNLTAFLHVGGLMFCLL